MPPSITRTTPDSFAHYPPIMAEAFARLAAQQERTDLTMQETGLKIQRLEESMSTLRENTDALTKSTSALTKSTKHIGEQLGGIANNQGSVTEEFFFNSLLEHPQIGPFKFSKIIPAQMIGPKGKQTEFDLVLVNGDSVVLVEVKYKLHPSHVDKLTEQIKKFKKFSPEFKGYDIYGALAGLSVPKDVVHAATEKGYMVLKRKGQQIITHLEGLRVQ